MYSSSACPSAALKLPKQIDVYKRQSKDYGLVPFGYKGTSDIGGYSKFDRNEIIKSQRYGCRKEAGDTNGAFCLGLIMADGWEIRDEDVYKRQDQGTAF